MGMVGCTWSVTASFGCWAGIMDDCTSKSDPQVCCQRLLTSSEGQYTIQQRADKQANTDTPGCIPKGLHSH